MFQIECITTEAGFDNLRPEWQELWQRSRVPSLFLTHDWIRCCWEEIGAPNALRIYVVRSQGRAIVIAPFMRSRRHRRRLPADCLTFIEHPETQLADFVLALDQEVADALKMLLHFLYHERANHWHILCLDKLPPHSTTVQMLASAAGALRARFEVRASHQALFIPIENTWERYVHSRSSRFRKTLRNVSNRLDRLGKVEVKRYPGNLPGQWAVQKLFAVSRGSWKVAEGIAITSARGRMEFFERLLEASDAGKGLQIWILEMNEQPIAAEAQIVDGDRVYALRSDYDDRYADSSPGSYLQCEILKNLFAGPAKEYNLGVGLNSYKMRWADHRVSLANFLLYRRSFYSHLLRSFDHYNFSRLKDMHALRGLHGLLPKNPS